MDGLDERKAVDLVTELIAVDGVSGEEEEIADLVVEKARRAGVPAAWIARDGAHRRSPAGGKCGNVIITLPGTRRAPRLMFSAHLDTVEIARGSVPVREGDRIRPRGDTALGADDRAGTAAVLNALLTVMERGIPHPPLTFLFTVQEEIGLFGARFAAVSRLKRPAACYNFDGDTPAEVVLKAPSSRMFDVTVQGKEAHAGQHPEKGISAAVIFAEGLAAVRRRGLFGKVERRGKKVATSNIGVVEGGTAPNVVMGTLRARGEARSYDEKLLDRIVRAYEEGFRAAAERAVNADGERGAVVFDEREVYRAFAVPRSAPAVKRVAGVLRELGVRPSFPAIFGGLDANWFNARGIPTVTLGAGARNPHTREEYLWIPDFLQACRVVLGIVQRDNGV